MNAARSVDAATTLFDLIDRWRWRAARQTPEASTWYEAVRELEPLVDVIPEPTDVAEREMPRVREADPSPRRVLTAAVPNVLEEVAPEDARVARVETVDAFRIVTCIWCGEPLRIPQAWIWWTCACGEKAQGLSWARARERQQGTDR